jgi:hypothetical protein
MKAGAMYYVMQEAADFPQKLSVDDNTVQLQATYSSATSNL